MSSILYDLRHGLRTILLHPGFSAIVVLTLATRIGVSTAVFSLVEQILLRPLPFSAPDRLVVLWENWPEQGLDRMWASPPNFVDWRREGADVFQDLAAHQDLSFNLTGDGEPERIEGSAVSASSSPCSACRCSSGARSCSRRSSRARRSPCSATISGAAASAATRESSARRSRSTTTATRSSG